jgi:hypothetical protein
LLRSGPFPTSLDGLAKDARKPVRRQAGNREGPQIASGAISKRPEAGRQKDEGARSENLTLNEAEEGDRERDWEQPNLGEPAWRRAQKLGPRQESETEIGSADELARHH